jgi:cyclophilin family peptidyl-prolyl cis-trans isomerase
MLHVHGRTRRLFALAVAGAVLSAHAVAAQPAAPEGTGPTIVIETEHGRIVIQTFADKAPKTVAHVTELVKKNFYTAQRIHRVVPGQAVQWGDKMSRDMTYREWWGRSPGGGSGSTVGVAEFDKTLKHRAGSVSMAHSGHAANADSQMFIALRAIPEWDGQYVIFGQVVEGMDAVRKLKVTDRLRRVTLE